MRRPQRPRRTAATGSNRVRIIGGLWRGRSLRFAPTPDLRPSPDRVRETLFNWLGQRLDGLRCLDLFAGSGALGFEALSRGAAQVIFVESNSAAAAALAENARRLNAQGASIIVADALAFLRHEALRFDVIFLDPPFSGDLLARAFPLLAPILADDGLVYVESAREFDPGAQWQRLRSGKASQVCYALFQRAAPSSPAKQQS